MSREFTSRADVSPLTVPASPPGTPTTGTTKGSAPSLRMGGGEAKDAGVSEPRTEREDSRETPLARSPLIAVDAMGYCWRVFPGEFWSMCPVNPDNSPIPRPLTFYAPVAMTEGQAREMVNGDSCGCGVPDNRPCPHCNPDEYEES